MLRKTTIIKQKKNTYQMMNLPILSVHRHKKFLSLSHTTLVIQMFLPSINYKFLNIDGQRSPAKSSSWKSFKASANKEVMADSAWIEAMQEELHQFDRLQVWELVDKPFGKFVIRLKWLWKNKKDEDQTVIRNKA
uniref:Putative ribonuclease H-like domain-containing protein n=1 Tax=Tanacetum cinerariifolium TaxID=118510 RepID=A0A699V4L0_TANCI|nr:putative ribonuclease H-like domain-containing protein [Tanacetum cinerariifolium]